MKTLGQFLILGLISIGLFACKTIKIKDGQIPDKYMGEVHKYMGNYVGINEGRKAEFKLSLDGNRVVFK